jgi:hypothetical protein
LGVLEIRNLLSRKITIDQKLVDKYRNDLLAGIAACPDSEKTLYRFHIHALEDLERSVKDGESIEKITSQIREERHAHGWSYLSGKQGEDATSSAHELLTDLEEQIIKIRGRDWYYSK